MDCECLALCPEYSTCPINVRTLPLTFLLSPGLTSWVWDLWSPVGPTVQKSPRLFLLCSAVIILQFAICFEQEVHPYFHFTLGSPDYVASLPIHFYFCFPFSNYLGLKDSAFSWLPRLVHSVGCPQGVPVARVVLMAQLHCPSPGLGLILLLPVLSPCFCWSCMWIGQEVALNMKAFLQRIHLPTTCSCPSPEVVL